MRFTISSSIGSFYASAISFIFIPFLMLGCVEFRDSEGESKNHLSPSLATEKKIRAWQIPSGELQAQALERQLGESFWVQLEIPSGPWRLRRTGVISKQILEREVQGGTFIDSQSVLGGETYIYELGFQGERQDFRAQRKSEITIPFDLILTNQFPVFVVKGELQKVQLKNIRYLKISRGQYILTQGYDVDIRAEKIFSDYGEIRTFEKNQKSGHGQIGRSAGQIKIKFDSVESPSHLIIHMRGEQGGDGDDGPHRSFGDAINGVGQPGGVGGNSGKLFIENQGGCAIESLHEFGLGGKGGEGGTGAHYNCGQVLCHALKGADGAAGANGELGEDCYWYGERWQCSAGRFEDNIAEFKLAQQSDYFFSALGLSK